MKHNPIKTASVIVILSIIAPAVLGADTRPTTSEGLSSSLTSLTEAAEFKAVLTTDAIPGWEVRKGPADTWQVKDSVLTCTGGGKLWGSWIGTREEYRDFIIEFDYKLAPGGNSGVLLRVPREGHPSTVGVEIQLLDDNADKHKNLISSQYTGSIYKIVAPSKRVARPAGEWNHIRIIAIADHIIVAVNGETIVDADGKSYPEILERSPCGPIGLQNHHTEISFRNMRLADLSGPQALADRMKWWREARFGTLVCWGPVTLKGTEIGWSRSGGRPGIGVADGEIPVEVYDNLYKQFNPVDFNANEWIAVAKAAGVRYFVFLTKHHDGFCMFDSSLTDYKITNSPFKRDVCREIADACHQAGLKLGWYYSQPDWRHPDYFTDNHKRYIEYLRGQVRELCTRYGKVDILWFDGLNAPADKWDTEHMFKMVRQLQPEIIINNRAGVPADFDTPEQWIGRSHDGRPWETCMTIGDQWSYKPDDQYKSLTECISVLVRTAGGNGNLLLNNGPMPNGRIDPIQEDRFRRIGEWLKRNGESIYKTHGGPYERDAWGTSTCRGTTVYLHVLSWDDNRIQLAPLPQQILKASLLNGQEVAYEQSAEGIEIALSRDRQDPIDTIIMLALDGNAEKLQCKPRLSGSLARECQATSSGTGGANKQRPARNAVDDDYSTFWMAGQTQSPEKLAQEPARIELDFGKPVRFDRIRLCEVLDRVGMFTLECRLDDSQEWHELARGTSIGQGRTFRFEIIEARYIRLSISKVYGYRGFQLAEFQVFPPAR